MALVCRVCTYHAGAEHGDGGVGGQGLEARGGTAVQGQGVRLGVQWQAQLPAVRQLQACTQADALWADMGGGRRQGKQGESLYRGSVR